MEKAGGKKRGRPRKGADASMSPVKDEAAGEGAEEAGGRVTRKQAARRRPLAEVDANAGEKDGLAGLAAGPGRATRRTRLGEKQAKEGDAGNGDGHGKDGDGILQVMLELEDCPAPKPRKGRGRRAVQEGAAGEEEVVGEKAEQPPKSSGMKDPSARPPLKEVPGLPSTYEERLELIRRVSESINFEVEFRCEALKATLEMQLPAVMAQLKLQQAKFSAAQLRMPLVEFVEKYCTHCGIVEREDGSLEIRKFDTSMAGDVGNGWAERQQQQDPAAAAPGLQQVQGNVVPTPAPAVAAADCSAEKWATRGLKRDRDNRDLAEIMSAYIQASASRDYGALTSPTMATPAMWRRGSLFTGPSLGAVLQPSRCGVTPRSERRPQRGELLMSINGSPLGHY